MYTPSHTMVTPFAPGTDTIIAWESVQSWVQQALPVGKVDFDNCDIGFADSAMNDTGFNDFLSLGQLAFTYDYPQHGLPSPPGQFGVRDIFSPNHPSNQMTEFYGATDYPPFTFGGVHLPQGSPAYPLLYAPAAMPGDHDYFPDIDENIGIVGGSCEEIPSKYNYTNLHRFDGGALLMRPPPRSTRGVAPTRLEDDENYMAGYQPNRNQNEPSENHTDAALTAEAISSVAQNVAPTTQMALDTPSWHRHQMLGHAVSVPAIPKFPTTPAKARDPMGGLANTVPKRVAFSARDWNGGLDEGQEGVRVSSTRRKRNLSAIEEDSNHSPDPSPGLRYGYEAPAIGEPSRKRRARTVHITTPGSSLPTNAPELYSEMVKGSRSTRRGNRSVGTLPPTHHFGIDYNATRVCPLNLIGGHGCVKLTPNLFLNSAAQSRTTKATPFVFNRHIYPAQDFVNPGNTASLIPSAYAAQSAAPRNLTAGYDPADPPLFGMGTDSQAFKDLAAHRMEYGGEYAADLSAMPEVSLESGLTGVPFKPFDMEGGKPGELERVMPPQDWEEGLFALVPGRGHGVMGEGRGKVRDETRGEGRGQVDDAGELFKVCTIDDDGMLCGPEDKVLSEERAEVDYLLRLHGKGSDCELRMYNRGGWRHSRQGE
ncbi:uncharacterized protein BDR25DRAFT_344661 [Lindgomyces ingoldianus]|uniref:Uncharacterized protein n=1 Tax=Lindgomyces ingoldianus TaxID=673940 RepID=A0ACB6QLZ1_9PLEO|nr:uncharacterized protein BDR25DRAFT_344661 [Lindgomyces ingoldianus]KAF2467926.1 hypothetical protein BDR25DRAFT_344661 [Lindgomyces ingoldianus]